jgi:23S rRNA C2498 (ribose-2'-O)-methylase RlmM
MTAFPGREPPRTKEDLAPNPPELAPFAHVEGLCGEEEALLKIPAKKRSREHESRLHEIGTELDRVWERLRERVERLEHRHDGHDGHAPA